MLVGTTLHHDDNLLKKILVIVVKPNHEELSYRHYILVEREQGNIYEGIQGNQ